MKITLLAIGKLKDGSFREQQAHYVKLLGKYGPLQVVEVRDEKLGTKRLSGAEAKRVLGAEGERLLEKTPKGSDLVALDKGGRARSSEELAAWLEKKTHGGRDLTFLIGGPLGLSEDVLESCRECLSLGPLTLPHQMARVVLLEQLYRAWTILRGETYHY